MSNLTAGENFPPLDQLSISQKICIFGAPFVAIVDGANSMIVQVCCNHWNCPKCGRERAKHEYGRIVNGARVLALEHELYFYTFTCRGRDLPLLDADNGYLLWTNRLLSTLRAKCKKSLGYWCYVQVTERQKRGHPHSHLLVSWLPPDAQSELDEKGKPYWESPYFRKAHVRAGLGTQCHITDVGSVEATSRYIAKYLFKDAMFTEMPKNWRRVRYSQNFPKAVEKATSQTATYIPILGEKSWRQVDETNVMFVCDNEQTYRYASKRTHRAMRPKLTHSDKNTIIAERD